MLQRSIAGRSRFIPFTLLFSIILVGLFCTCFRLFVGVDDDDESCRVDRRPFTDCGDDNPFGRFGLDTLLDIEDFRDDDLDDDAVLPFVSASKGAIFFKCSIRCVGLLI